MFDLKGIGCLTVFGIIGIACTVCGLILGGAWLWQHVSVVIR